MLFYLYSKSERVFFIGKISFYFKLLIIYNVVRCVDFSWWNMSLLLLFVCGEILYKEKIGMIIRCKMVDKVVEEF